jgi:hypothetical protein
MYFRKTISTIVLAVSFAIACSAAGRIEAQQPGNPIVAGSAALASCDRGSTPASSSHLSVQTLVKPGLAVTTTLMPVS